MIRKRLTACIVAAVMTVTMLPAMSYAETGSEGNGNDGYEDNQLLVVYNQDAECSEVLKDAFEEGETSQSSDVEELADENIQKLEDETDVSAESGEFITGSTASDGAMLRVELEDGQDIDEAISSIENQPDVAYVQKNYCYQLTDAEEDSEYAPLMAANDEMYSSQYYLKSWTEDSETRGAGVSDAWDYTRTEGKVTVAVIDTGIDIDHPDLVDNIDMEHSKAIVGTLDDTIGHGTHVAGIIGATAGNGVGIAGTSYNADIIAINVFEKTESGYTASTASMIAAFSYIEELVSTGEVADLHVINFSGGQYVEPDQALRLSIKKLREDYNVVTVCAGGNGDGKSVPRQIPVYPADYEECVAVTALNKDGTNVDYSDYNLSKDISAPGKSIYSTYRGGNYANLSGTSMAAPIVSGAMALLWAGCPDITVSQAVESIKKTAVPVNTATNDRGKLTGSAGAIDCEGAYIYASTNYKGEDIRKSITAETASLSYSSCTYSGSARKPTVKVGTLTLGKDYTVTYSNNVKVGTAAVTVKGAGKYSGTIKKTFKINPKGTSLKSLSRYKRAFKAYWSRQKTQTTGYQLQYSRYSNFKSSKSKYISISSSSKKVTGLSSKKYYYVRIRTYKKVNGVTYYSSWSKAKRVKTK